MHNRDIDQQPQHSLVVSSRRRLTQEGGSEGEAPANGKPRRRASGPTTAPNTGRYRKDPCSGVRRPALPALQVDKVSASRTSGPPLQQYPSNTGTLKMAWERECLSTVCIPPTLVQSLPLGSTYFSTTLPQHQQRGWPALFAASSA